MATPDFSSLANTQFANNTDAARLGTWANRADQSNGTGQMTWNQDASGRWVQNVTNRYQGQNDQLGTQATTDLGNLGEWGSTDLRAGVSAMPDGSYGATQGVIDATSRLQQPAIQQNEDATRARMAAMGITLGSDASNTSERNLGNVRTDAQDRAILAGTTEYGNVFQRQMAQRQQGIGENAQTSNLVTALRGAKMGEATGALSAIKSNQPTFGSYQGATIAPPNDQYGAAADGWKADQYMTGLLQNSINANQAASANRTSGNMSLLGLGMNAFGLNNGGLGSTIKAGARGLSNWWGGSPSDSSGYALSNYGAGGSADGVTPYL